MILYVALTAVVIVGVFLACVIAMVKFTEVVNDLMEGDK